MDVVSGEIAGGGDRIDNFAVERMCGHLAAAYPREGCGILAGHRRAEGGVHIRRAIGTRNSEISRGNDRYALDPRDFMTVQRALDAAPRDRNMLGFFHSHPDAPALPSRTDLERARELFETTGDFFIYAIGSVNRGVAQIPRFWRLAERVQDFVELRMIYCESSIDDADFRNPPR